jgi:hypothetical protein
MFTDKKDIQCHRKIFVPNPIVFQEQLQEKHAVSTSISYFKKYVAAEVFEDFFKMTNIYTLQNNAVFKHTDFKNIRQLFGLHMYMGCNKLPRFRMYWSLAMDLGKFQRTPTMSLRHFSQLRNNLNIVNSLQRPIDCVDKLYKMRPILDCIRARCQQWLALTELVGLYGATCPRKKCELKPSAVVFRDITGT